MLKFDPSMFLNIPDLPALTNAPKIWAGEEPSRDDIEKPAMQTAKAKSRIV
jgi:hypothetical protein